jgi:hypothetical protein
MASEAPKMTFQGGLPYQFGANIGRCCETNLRSPDWLGVSSAVYEWADSYDAKVSKHWR